MTRKLSQRLVLAGRRTRTALLAGPACLVAVLGCVQPAAAVILPATTIDGPSQEIVGFGGVAMAEDGTGGVVYLKKARGVALLFVSRFPSGHGLPPIQVDRGQSYAASWPRIGAADDG